MEKVEGAYDVVILKQKINEIIGYLNSQAQPEENEPEKVYVEPIVPNFTEELSAPVEYKTRKQVKEMFKDTPEEWSWKFLKGGCEPTDYSKQPKMEEELHDKLLEIWCGLLPTPSKASFDPEPIRIRIEGTEKYVKQLLEEREREVRKQERMIRIHKRVSKKIDNLEEPYKSFAKAGAGII